MKNKNLIIGIMIAVVVLSAGVSVGLYVNSHNFNWQAPAVFRKPLSITKKLLVKNVTIVQQADSIPLNENEKYLCIKFGDQCKTALQIQHLENGTEQCDRFHVNSNGTVDFGFMQVNTVHLKKGYTIAQLIDCKSNIDIAYEIYKGSGWGAWSTYKLIK